VPTTPTYPGVYIEEIPSGVRTITGVATSVAAFVDYFERGPMNRAVQLFSIGDFQREFGGLNSQSEASYAIQQFFLNGGTEAWVVRVASDDPATVPEEPAAAEVQIDNDIPAATPAALTVRAISPGEWGNHLRVRVDGPLDGGKFNITVSNYAAVNGRTMLVGQETFRNLSVDNGQKTFAKSVVNDPDTGSKLVQVEANGGDPPLANGTVSGLLGPNPQVPDASPKVRVAIGDDSATTPPRVTIPLTMPVGTALPGPVALTTIAAVLQSSLRGSKPAEPAFAGANVEVVGDRLRVLAGGDDPENRVTFWNIAASPLATNLKLRTDTSAPADARASARRATLSGSHDPTGPQIPAASVANVRIGTTGSFTTAALEFSGLPEVVTLPGAVPLRYLAPVLQDAIVGAGTSFSDAQVRDVDVAGSRLLILPPPSATNQVEFANAAANVPVVDNLKLRTDTSAPADARASVRRATLSGEHSDNPQIDDIRIDIKIDTGSPTTQEMTNLTTGPVALQDIAPELQDAIVVAGATGTTVRVLENRLLVLPPEGTSIEFTNTATTQTADRLKLRTDANAPADARASARRATLSGSHGSSGPQIPAAPPVNVMIGAGNPVPAILKFPNTVVLPRKVNLETIRETLQAAIRLASPGNPAFAQAVATIVRGNRLLVVPGQNDTNTVEFTDTAPSRTAEVLQLTGAPTLMAVLSGDHNPPRPVIPVDPEVDVTIGGNKATAAPDLGPGTNESLDTIASRLQEAIGRAQRDNPAFSGTTINVVENRFLVLPGGTSPATQIQFADTTENMTASALQLTTATDAKANLQEYRLGATSQTAARLRGEVGTSGIPPNASALIGVELSKTGIYALEDVDLFNLLCIPRVADLSPDEALSVISSARDLCEKRRAFFLVDTPKGVDELQEIKNRMANIPRHRNAALFYPRVKIPDPLDDFRLRSVGASGTMAGLFARIDATRGVWKAPAGTEATLVNVSQLEDVLTDQQNGALNPLAINCLRNFPIYGNVSWGARTLEGSDQQASEWKYIPVRRLALFLEESLYRGIKWVVFEPNDEPLWSQIRLNVGAFMQNLFRQGAFQGQTPREAYFVKCDGETTTQNDINLGIVNILVGFAPLKPAEFVILKIQQMAGQIET
jgi:phage tail sheath protein FI